MNPNPQSLVGLLGLEKEWVLELFAQADRLRAVRGTPKAPKPLAGKTAALVFHKPSLRTRVSFTVGMHELGGDAVDLTAVEVSEHGRESVPDVAHVLSGMCDLIVARTFSHTLVQGLAKHATIPVINALTDHSHPCQILADLYTLWRQGRDLDDMTVTWVGDGNNVLHSWLEAATIFDFRLRVAVPDGFEAGGDVRCRHATNSRITACGTLVVRDEIVHCEAVAARIELRHRRQAEQDLHRPQHRRGGVHRRVAEGGQAGRGVRSGETAVHNLTRFHRAAAEAPHVANRRRPSGQRRSLRRSNRSRPAASRCNGRRLRRHRRPR